MRKIVQKQKEAVESKSKLKEVMPLREYIRKAKETWEKSYIDLARCMWEIHQNHEYENWDYLSMQDYCEQELDFHYRRAMFMVDIYGSAVLFNIPLERLDAIGWTKAREIVKVINLDNMDAWLEEAENSTLKDLSQKIKDAKKADPVDLKPIKEKPERDQSDKPEKSQQKSSTLVFKTEGFEYDMIMSALDDAKASLNTSNSTFALSTICMEWRASKVDEANPDTFTLDQWIAFINQMFNTNIQPSVGKSKDLGLAGPDTKLKGDYTDEEFENVLDELDDDLD